MDPTSPAFPFGYGLDYLQISYRSFTARLSTDKKHIVATATVQNAAAMAGQTVLEVYFTPPPCRLTRKERCSLGLPKSTSRRAGVLLAP